MRPGLCVTPTFLPTADELARLRPAFLRSLLYSTSDLDRLLATGLPLLLTVNNECREVGGDWSGWDGAMAEVALRGAGRVLGVCVGNELDLYWANDPNDVPPAFAADLARRAAAILRPGGIKTIAPSVAGPRWQDYLREMAGLLGDEVDAYDLHPYGQRPSGWGAPAWGWGDLSNAVASARDLTGGRRLVFSEYGVKVGDAGGEDMQAAFLAAAANEIAGLWGDAVSLWSWFAYTDAIGTPEEQAGGAGFGLVRADGSRRPSWQAFAGLAAPADHADTGGDPDPVVLLPSTPPIPEVPSMPALTQCLQRIWQAVVPLPYDETISTFGIPSYWRDHLAELGSPVGEEVDDDEHPGCKLQPFALGVLRWRPDGTVERAA